MTTTEVSLCAMSWQAKKKAMSALPRKQMVLLACDIARVVLPIWDRYDGKDDRPFKAIQAAEHWVVAADAADAADAVVDAAADAAYAADAAADAAYAAAYAARAAAADAARAAAYAAAYAARAVDAAADAADAADAAFAADAARAAADAADATYAARAAPEKIKAAIDRLYLQTTRQVIIPTSRDVDNLARLIVTERQLESAPILADALEDAGFSCPESLLELRSGDFCLSHCVLWSLFERGAK